MLSRRNKVSSFLARLESLGPWVSVTAITMDLPSSGESYLVYGFVGIFQKKLINLDSLERL